MQERKKKNAETIKQAAEIQSVIVDSVQALSCLKTSKHHNKNVEIAKTKRVEKRRAQKKFSKKWGN